MTQNSLFELSFCPFGKDIRIIFSATELILKINGARTNLKGRTSSFSLLHCLTRRIFLPYIHISTNHITPLKYQHQLQSSMYLYFCRDVLLLVVRYDI